MTRAHTSPSPVPGHRATALFVALLATLFATLAGTALPVVLAQPASAVAVDPSTDATVTWGVRPADAEPHAAGRANFAYTAAPGGTIEDAVVISNHGTAPTTLRVYVADAFTTTRGVLDLLRPDQPSMGVGAWTDVAAPEVVVPAGASVTVPFTLRVPDHAEPGDHAGGVVTSLVSTRADGVSVDRRLGARLHLRVDGPLAPGAALEGPRAVHHGSLDPTAGGAVDVEVDVVNTGNVRVGGPATVTVAGPFGWGGQVVEVDVPELLPGERTTVAVRVDDVRPLLRLTATVRLVPHVVVDGSRLDPVTASVSTAAVPWTALALVLLVLAAVVTGRWRARRRAAATERRVAEAVAAARAQAEPTPVA
ncbi:WxL protein peptidoglycan domain-containing protein [Cellulomonas xiejunii]|uniref:WxL protein peptidoglycan domain-containing protein n=1 Tax=Cellulomonas xiejunii TaxID=2968083 RepID=UPI001D0EBCCE|nr:DUF916 domain-containing protein [Cellulomonas xiejunii]MCC2314544.1 DUF916 domain-containing protein [Cellulomonas xiejunii]